MTETDDTSDAASFDGDDDTITFDGEVDAITVFDYTPEPLEDKDLFSDEQLPDHLEFADHPHGSPSMYRGEDVKKAVNHVLMELQRQRTGKLATADSPMDDQYIEYLETVIAEAFPDLDLDR